MKSIFLDIAGFIGAGSIIYGISLVNIPAAFIFGGIFLIAGAVLHSLKD